MNTLKEIIPYITEEMLKTFNSKRDGWTTMKTNEDWRTYRVIQNIILTNQSKKLSYKITYNIIREGTDDFTINYEIEYLDSDNLLIPTSTISPKEVKGSLNIRDMRQSLLNMFFMKIPKYYQSIIQLKLYQVPLITMLHGKVEEFIRRILGYD